jgi:hypothetical protein
MKKFSLSVLLISILCFSCDTLKLPVSTSITDAEAAQGIREALNQGVDKGISFLNKADGFFGNEAYKLFLPPDAKKIENTQRTIGMGNMVDKAILQINRGAEDAVGYAKPIFVDAIKSMTISDAINIVRGQSDAATNYFRQKTTEKLTAAFTPVIKNSLVKLSATKYYADVVNSYNTLPTTFNKINPDLPSVVGKAVEALFRPHREEEANIREKSCCKNNRNIEKVFGSVNH